MLKKNLKCWTAWTELSFWQQMSTAKFYGKKSLEIKRVALEARD